MERGSEIAVLMNTEIYEPHEARLPLTQGYTAYTPIWINMAQPAFSSSSGPHAFSATVNCTLEGGAKINPSFSFLGCRQIFHNCKKSN